jgi:hypothetical protein
VCSVHIKLSSGSSLWLLLKFCNCRHVHDGCDEAVDLHRTKPEEYVCRTCKNRSLIPVSASALVLDAFDSFDCLVVGVESSEIKVMVFGFHVCFLLLVKTSTFAVTCLDLNRLTRPKVIVDRYYQAQLTEIDIVSAKQVLEVTFVCDGLFHIQRWSECEVNAVLTFLLSSDLSAHVEFFICVFIYMYDCLYARYCAYDYYNI